MTSPRPVGASRDGLSRRAFVWLAGGGTLLGAALPLLNACAPAGTTVPAAAPASEGKPTSTAGSTSGVAVKPNSALPSYIPLQSATKPDYPSAGPQYEDGWDSYPWPPMKAWNKEPPGLGGTI